MSRSRSRRRQAQPDHLRSPAWRQAVDHPTAWGQEHKWFLAAIFSLFDRNGSWTSVEDVEADLAATAPDQALNVAQPAVDLPHELGARHVNHVQLKRPRGRAGQRPSRCFSD